MEITWRSTRLRTNDAIYLDIPNNEMVSGTIVNLHYPTQIHAMRIRVGVDYDVPPNRVKDALLRAASSAEGVLPTPPVRVFVVDFADPAVLYEIKFSMGNHQAYNESLRRDSTNIRDQFKRQRITIPYPIRWRLQVHAVPPECSGRACPGPGHLARRAAFRLPERRPADHVLHGARASIGSRARRTPDPGRRQGDSMFVMLRGPLHVSVLRNGTVNPAGGIAGGRSLRGMSSATGEPPRRPLGGGRLRSAGDQQKRS